MKATHPVWAMLITLVTMLAQLIVTTPTAHRAPLRRPAIRTW
ncbi:hypothetical protein [Nonomuraea insulae]|uniref:Uncharacterized protein n=1 Tax=Nonomuraea insulae TaxID=1616787 RepID=A0ABW1D0P4_9ACTN